MKTITTFQTVQIKNRIFIGRGILSEAARLIKSSSKNGKAVILTDRRVKRLWLDKLQNYFNRYKVHYQVIVLPQGEKYKSFDTYRLIIDKLVTLGLDRHSTLVTFGGGVIGDLGGFVAATYKRGIRLIHIPTTLIAQIDSSIGSKVAIDLPEGKNLIGTYYYPDFVITDTDILSTLSIRDYHNGLYEAIKISLVNDAALYKFIKLNLDKILGRKRIITDTLVKQCINDKIMIVEKDPFDYNARMILNFGHTLGHALETTNAYKLLSHGEAVGWGMLLALHLSESSGLCRNDSLKGPYRMIEKLLRGKRFKKFDGTDLWCIISNDKKKKGNQVRFVLLSRIGRPVIKKVDRKEFLEALGKI
jgi:3-dehydroquinate synthase